jgi:uncharacterized delta-60 repeat protein
MAAASEVIMSVYLRRGDEGMPRSRHRCWLLLVVISIGVSTLGAIEAQAVAGPSAQRDQLVDALAAPGDLDSSFGQDGRVTTDFQSHARAQGIAFQADGKVIVTGVAGAFRSDDQDIAVARYLESGRLDRSFGGEGRVRTDVTGKNDTATSVLLQPDGMILVGGAGDTFPGSERPIFLLSDMRRPVSWTLTSATVGR